MSRLLLRDLQPGHLYKVQVRSVSEGAVSEWSHLFDVQTTGDVIAPNAPSALTWVTSGTAFKATWVAPTKNEDGSVLADFRDYQVTLYSSADPATKVVFYTNATNYDFPFESNVNAFGQPRASVTIEVRGRDNSGNTSQTPITKTATNAAPSTPGGFTGFAMQDAISLKWNAVTDDDLKTYKVYYGTTPANVTTLVYTGLGTAYVHNNTAYAADAYYAVVAVDVFNTESNPKASFGPIRPLSPFTVDTTPPPAVTGLAATLSTAADGTMATATVSWAAVSATDLAGYTIQYREVGTTDYASVKADADQTKIVISPLKPYVNYEFKIRSFDWSANNGSMSATVTTTTASVNAAPATVTGVAIAGGKDSVTVSWTENTESDVVNGAGMYLVDIATNAAFSTGLLSYKTGSTNITVTGLAQGTPYFARVKAVDSRGLASASWSTAPSTTTGTISQFTHTVGPTAPSNPKTGDIWMDTTSGFEKQWSGTAWANTGNASTSYVDSKTNTLVKTYATEYAVNASETVAPTTGWSTATPTRTAGSFIWQRVTVTYADGTTSATNAALLTGNAGATGPTGPTGATGSQGIQGPVGPTGQTLYTWIKYADTPTTGMSDLPTGKAYFGIAYNKASATESSVYSDYDWSLIVGPQGNQGVQGPTGANGQPTYTWIKYATSATGTGLSDSPTGMTYIGIAYNKTTPTESNLATDYEWSLIQGPQGPQGVPGAPAAIVSLTATSQALISPAAGGATNPTISTVTGTAVNTTITAWTYSVDGAAFSATVPAGVSRTANVVTITGSTMTARTITVRMADAAGISDTLTVAKVLDGATGAQGPTGNTGSTGSTGSTGAAGADAYTVILTNEAQVFAGTVNAAIAGSASTAVIAYKGAVQQTATIGTITGQVTGLTTAITNNGANNATVTVTVTSALVTQSGTLTIPVTVGGVSFTKTFAWSVSYAGAAGSTGATGNTGATGATGVSITSVTPYFYQIATGSAVPAKPTLATPPAPWTTTEPDYVANTELYRTEKVLFSDASFQYTNVAKVSSYAAAATAIASANGKNKIIHSTGTPGTTANSVGDTWVQYDASNNIIAQFRGNGGTSWTQQAVSSTFIANLDAGKLTAGSAFITTLNVGAGGAIQSAGYTAGGTSGFQLSTSGLIIKGTGNTVDAGVIKGGTITGTTVNIGAGGVLNIDATAVVKSNNYSANSTGYQLSSSGLEINDGSVNVKALKSGTIDSAAITLSGPNGKISGTGFSLSGSGLVVTSGSIDAAALNIQQGQNLIPVQYADFEFASSYYTTSKAITSSTPNPWSINADPAYVRSGTQSLAVTGLPATQGNIIFGSNYTSTYNIPVDAGQTYIFSGYFYSTATAGNPQPYLRVKYKETATFGAFNTRTDLTAGAWTRISGSLTVPAGITMLTLYIDLNPYTGTLYINQLQFERKMGALNTPSPWSPPSTTSIDGGFIRTGELRSTTFANGVTGQPAWSINMQGNAQFGDALVRGRLLVGDPAATDGSDSTSRMQSTNYVLNSTGWMIRSDGYAEFRNLAANSIRITSIDTPLQNTVATKLYDYMEDGSLWATRSGATANVKRRVAATGAYSANALIEFVGDASVSRDAAGVSSGIAFEPEALYRITARVRQVTGNQSTTSTSGYKATIGVLGLDQNGVLCGWDGSTNINNQYFVAAYKTDVPVFDDTDDQSAGWQSFTGYLKGRAEIGTSGAAPDQYAPASVHKNVRYIVPYVRMNEGNTTYVAQVDAFMIETFNAGAQTKVSTNTTGSRAVTIETIDTEPVFDHAVRFYTADPAELKPGILSSFVDGDAFNSLSLLIAPPVGNAIKASYDSDNITLRGTNSNMVYDNGFTNGVGVWQPYSSLTTLAQGQVGRRDDVSLQATLGSGATSTSTNGAYIEIDPSNFDGVIGSARIVASAWVYPVNRDMVVSARLAVKGQDENGVTRYVDGTGYTYTTSPALPQGVWTRVVVASKGYAPLPDDTNYVQALFYCGTNSVVGDQFYIDDVQIEAYDYDNIVRKNWIPNPDFVDSPVTGTPNGFTNYYSSGTPQATGTRAVVSGVMQFNSVAFSATTGSSRFGNYVDCYVDPIDNDRYIATNFTRSGGNASTRACLYVDCYDDSGAIVTSGSSLPTYSTATSGTITYAIPGDSTISRIRVYWWVDAQNTVTSGITATFTKPILTDSSDITYFSGATSGAQWDYTANASSSTKMTPVGTLPAVADMATDAKNASASQTVINTDSTLVGGSLWVGAVDDNGILPPVTDFYQIAEPNRPDVAKQPLVIMQSSTTNWTIVTIDDYQSTGLYRSALDIRGWDPDGTTNAPGIRLFNANDEYSPGRFAIISPRNGYSLVTLDKYGNMDADSMMNTRDFYFYGYAYVDGSPPWQTLTPLATGWGYYAGSYTAGFYRNYDTVYLRGIVQRTGAAIATAAQSQLIGTLPSGFRPTQTVYMSAHFWGSSPNTGSLLIYISTSGAVYAHMPTASIPQNGFVNLDGLSFSLSADTTYSGTTAPPADTTAPGAPSSLSISAVASGTKTGTYKVSWTNSSASDFGGAKILWRTDRYPSVSIASSGTKKLTTDGKVITISGGSGAKKSYTHTGLPVNKYIYYRVVTYDKAGNHSGYISGRRYLLASPIIINPTSSKSWRDDWGGQWRTDTDDVYQGEYSGYNSNHRGLWFYNGAIKAKLNTGGVRRTPTRVTVFLYRQNSAHGAAGDTSINLYAHGYTYTSKPAGVPTILGGSSGSGIVRLSRGVGKTVTIPSGWYSGFASGANAGLGVYSSSSSEYAILTGKTNYQSNGKLTIYHRG